VAFSAGGDGGRRPPELPAQNSHTSFAATSDALEILIDGMVWIGGIRGFLLEHGVPVRQGHRFLRQQLPQILATRAVTDEIETLARADESCQRLITVRSPANAVDADTRE